MHGCLDGVGGVNLQKIDARDRETPILTRLAHLVRHQLLDLLARRQRIVQTHVTNHATERRLNQTLHSLDNIVGLEVIPFTQSHLVSNAHRIGDLDHHHRMDDDFHVITRDDRLKRKIEDRLTQIHAGRKGVTVLSATTLILLLQLQMTPEGQHILSK